MGFDFVKYQGTGNDFVMIDGRGLNLKFTASEISKICDRRFGIGADGLIILLNHPELDFEMDYYNSDGSKSFCGNGSRCAQAFAKDLGMIDNNSNFLAIDGIHEGKIEAELYATKMGDVKEEAIQLINSDFFIHTGSPHYIVFCQNVDSLDVYGEGRKIRYSDAYKAEGTNVNFVQELEDAIKVRTYERGVEDETLSCGTGVTAAAIAYLKNADRPIDEVKVKTKGGDLSIRLEPSSNGGFESIWLVGPAQKVFSGSYSI